ncbi:MAG TPA: alpha/beta hydrolase-fold protein [Longimicrobiales bacterium]
MDRTIPEHLELPGRITAPTVMRFFVAMARRSAVLLAVLTAAAPLHAQMPDVGVIDFYGLRTLRPADLAAALSLQIGDSINPRLDLKRRLLGVPGVADAEINVVCCDAGRSIVYVGIQEDGVRPLTFAATPAGSVQLPAGIVTAGREFSDALFEGVRRGQSGEDDSAGYAVMSYPPAQKVQQTLIAYAQSHFDVLRDVLRNSSAPDQRALAAQMSAYAADRAAVKDELLRAVTDPAPEVRNNALRALAVMAVYKQSHPDAPYDVPFTPFISLLNSLNWTDRNKAAFALTALTASREPALLQLLRDSAFEALAEMARWKVIGHAGAAGIILGRIAGLPEDSIFRAFQRNREAVIRAAAATRGQSAAPPRGHVQQYQLHSSVYGTDRRIWVYTPAGYDQNRASPYDLIVAFDGADYRDTIPLPLILDTLTATRRTRPFVAVMIDDYDGAQRIAELGNSARFARFVGSELMPWVRQRLHVTTDPQRTIITGSSAGGLAAAFVALQRPDLFGNVLAQSGAFWRGAEGANTAPFEWLTQQYASRPRLDIRFYLDVGSTETHAVLGGSGPVFIDALRRFRQALTRRGYDVAYAEVPGGVHAPASWRRQLPAALVLLAAPR